MTEPGSRVTLLALAVTAALVAPAAERIAAGRRSDEGTKVSTGEGMATPDSPVVVPLMLSAAEGVQVGEVTIRLRFPKASLAFVKMEPSGLALGVGAKLRSEVKPGKTADTSVLEASVSTIAGGGSRNAIPPGPMAYVTFHIDAKAEPESAIPLTLEATVVTRDDPPKPVAPVTTGAADIGVASPPVPACFFYMH